MLYTVSHMIKEFLIAGSDWIAEVPVDEKDTHEPDLKVEAATRAVEAVLGKRDDIDLYAYDGILGKDGEEKNELQETLMELVREELEPGCRIGCLLVITQKGDKEFYFINSKIPLSNAGVYDLANKFDKKYPDQKNLKGT